MQPTNAPDALPVNAPSEYITDITRAEVGVNFSDTSIPKVYFCKAGTTVKDALDNGDNILTVELHRGYRPFIYVSNTKSDMISQLDCDTTNGVKFMNWATKICNNNLDKNISIKVIADNPIVVIE